eukprot:g5745.t1
MSSEQNPGVNIGSSGSDLVGQTSSAMDEPLLDHSTGESEMELRKSAVRKLNWRIGPYCSLITILSYIDRGNLGFAASKICTELHLSHSEYGFGAALFFVGYVLSQVPSNLILKRIGASRWLAVLLITWGLIASSLAFIQRSWQFYLLRFLLGLAEGGTFPGVWYYISTFFPNALIPVPLSLVEASVQLAAPVSAPLAAGLLALDGVVAGADGWRLLFFIEGVLPIIYGVLIPWILPASPKEAHFLTVDEKDWLESKLKCNESSEIVGVIDQMKTVFRNLTFWLISVSFFLRFVVFSVAMYWMTLIIDDMIHGDDEDDDDEDTCASSKSTGAAAVLLSVVPFSMCASFCLYLGHISHRVENRSKLSGIIESLASVFWVVWFLFRHVSFTVALLAVGCAISFGNGPTPFILGILTSHFDFNTRATALAVMNTLASFGGIVGPIAIGFTVDAHGYGVAVLILAVVNLISGGFLLFTKDS